jgi:hypothetical protein
MQSSVDDAPLRDSAEYKVNLKEAWPAFCRSMRAETRKNLSARDREILDWCKSKSIHPMLTSLSKMVPESCSWQTSYDMVPPDIMHTVMGVMENWLNCVLVIITKLSGKLRGKYMHAISRLDKMLINFPWRHAMKNLSHFDKGITAFCTGMSGTDKEKTTGFGKLGMIDAKEVPMLVLQVLLCKS